MVPDAEFVSPNAPFPCDMAPFGFQWLSARDPSPEARLAGARVHGHPDRPGLDQVTSRSGHGRRALGPARPDRVTERVQPLYLAPHRVAAHRHRDPAQQPVRWLVPARVGQVILGGVLQVAGQGIEPETARRGDVGAAHDARDREYPACRRARGEGRRAGGIHPRIVTGGPTIR